MMILVLVLLVGVGVSVLLARWRRRVTVRQGEALSDARAEARRWYDRLGGQLVTLRDDSHVAQQALVDATERHQAASAQLSQATTISQFRLVRETCLEGLAYIGAARTALGLDPGPDLPPIAAARGVGMAERDHHLYGYGVAPQASSATPYYYPGGYSNGRAMPAGWYSTPWWKTALAAGAGTLGGMMLFDSLLSLGHHGGPGPFDGDGFDFF